MAVIKSAVVQALDTNPVVDPSTYLGNVQHLRLDFDTSGNVAGDTVELSKPLSNNARVIKVELDATGIDNGGTVQIGIVGDTDKVLPATATAAAIDSNANVEVGGKALVAEFAGADPADGSATGYALIVTDQ